MLNIGPQELLVILVIALLVVGPQRLPALGRSLGRGLREMRRAQDEVRRTIQVTLEDDGDGERPGTTDRAGTSERTTRGRPSDAASAEDGSSAGRAERPPPVRPEPVPSASEPLPASELREVTRTLGRSLAELRRARDEVRRSFRVDLNEPAAPPAPAPAEPAELADPDEPDEPAAGP